VVAAAARSRSIASAGLIGCGYAGWLMIRTQPFWVIGQEAQPWPILASSQARAAAW